MKNDLGAQYKPKILGNRENQKIMFSSFEINLILILDHQSTKNWTIRLNYGEKYIKIDILHA